jgi:hypothetical protein
VPQIEVTRSTKKWPDGLRAYNVVIDGEVAEAVRQGQTIKTPVQPGRHEVWIRIDWCRSPAVVLDLGPGETARLECAPNAQPLLWFLYVTIWRGRYVSLRRLDTLDIAKPS